MKSIILDTAIRFKAAVVVAILSSIVPMWLVDLLLHWDFHLNAISEIKPYLLPCVLAIIQWLLLIRRSRLVYFVQISALILYGWRIQHDSHLPVSTVPLAMTILISLTIWLSVEVGGSAIRQMEEKKRSRGARPSVAESDSMKGG